MFENNGHTYSKLGCKIMEYLAKAQWNSSIEYPRDGWHICSVCEKITNEIDTCEYCDEWVCWDCSHEATNDIWNDSHFCSYECYRSYYAELKGEIYDPEIEHKDMIMNRIDRILNYFDKEKLINILNYIQTKNGKCVYENFEKITKEKINEIINHYSDYDIYTSMIELYEEDTEEYLEWILDGEAYINNLDPNDPADAWFFED
jgi:methionine synthase II (cobalamin-independent)